MATLEIDGLNAAESSFRERFRREPWYVKVEADHKNSCLQVQVLNAESVPAVWQTFEVRAHETTLPTDRRIDGGTRADTAKCIPTNPYH